jgi:hypothetical protein
MYLAKYQKEPFFLGKLKNEEIKSEENAPKKV